LAFKHLDFNCHLDFGIWNLAKGIATHFPPVIASPDLSGRSNLGGGKGIALSIFRKMLEK